MMIIFIAVDSVELQPFEQNLSVAFAYRVDRNLVRYHPLFVGLCGLFAQLVRNLPLATKGDAEKPSCIWGLKTRIRPNCRVTTPL
jgi:hypothetical protein